MAASTSAAASLSSGTTLSEIFKVDPKLMQRKFQLEPLHHYDPQEKDNLVFLSPTVLLDDRELREGGWKERGAKEVLGCLAKDILQSKDYCLFQVPEITSFQMGYGKRSENKKHKMALTETDAKGWMEIFDLAAWKARKGIVDDDDESMTESEKEIQETSMQVDPDFTLPTPEDHQALEFESEDLIDPSDSGLKIRGVKSRYLLFFSILLTFYRKKLASADAKERKIAENKVSDFLLFWILPYLLNFTQQQVNIVNEHHKVESKTKGLPQSSVQTVEMSAMDIIVDAFESCHVKGKLEETILEKFRKYYGTDKLEQKYRLPAVVTGDQNEPIILVPLRHQVTKRTVKIQDIGRRWRDIGRIHLFDEFLEKFIQSRAVQKDFFYSIREQEEVEKYAVDYGILLPDEDTFNEFIGKIEEEYPDLFLLVDKQGEDLNTPRLGLVKNAGKTVSVCFSYFEGNDAKKVAALFRVTGANRLNSFTIALLHGACVNPCDRDCKLMSLYPVESAKKYAFKDGKLRKCKVNGNFEGRIGHFCKLEFPETFKSWQQAVRSEGEVKELISKSRVKLDYPEYEHNHPLNVPYTTSKESKLKKHPEKLKKFRAVNLQGCLLRFIARSGSKGNVAVILAMNDCLKEICPFTSESLKQSLSRPMRKTITHFVRALVVAGLPKVFPAKGSDATRKIESETDDDSSDSESDDSENESLEEQMDTEATSSTLKKGILSEEVLEDLSRHIAPKWKQLGRRLEFKQPQLFAFHKDNEEEEEKAYQMLLSWLDREGSAASYQVLNDALCHPLVGKKALAEKFCYN